MEPIPPTSLGADAPPREHPRLVGVIFAGRYAIERELGEGATSIVYIARDTRDERQVAIKTLRPELAESLSAQRFLREIGVSAKLDHPAIVPVIDSGAHMGILYCVLPYMKGGTLRDRLERKKQLPVDEAIEIGATLADALAYAHTKNLMHRDVKPENILFDGDRVALADFGIAKAIERAAGDSTTVTGVVRGTPAYMSPEQAGGEREFDGRSDIYSLGCVLYEMVAGVRAFIGPTPQSIVAQRLIHVPRPMTVYRPTAPPALAQVVERALATAPADRYQHAADLATALREAKHAPRPKANRKPLFVALGVAAVAILAAALIVSSPWRRRSLEAREALVRGDLYSERFRTPEQMRQAIAAYETAARLDPELAVAYARLSQAHSYTYADFDHSDERKRRAKEALDQALRLAPTLSDTRLALGFYMYFVDGQRDSAMVYLTAARDLQEGNAALIAATATMLRAGAQWEAALALSRRAAALEPQSPRWATEVASTELWMNRYADADRDFQRAIQLRPDNISPYVQRIYLQMLWKGDTAAVRTVLAEAETRIPRIEILKGFIPRFRSSIPMFGPEWQNELERLSLAELGVPAGAYYLAKMELFQRRGRLQRSRAYADSAVAEFEPRARASPGDEYLRGELAFAYAGQGRAADARREAEAAMDLVIARDDATLRAFRSANLVLLYIAIGDHDRAVARLRMERRNATILSRQMLANYPDFAPLRGRADFQALLRTFP